LEIAGLETYVNIELEKISEKFEITGEGAEAALPSDEKRQSLDSIFEIDTLKDIKSVDSQSVRDAGGVMLTQPNDEVHGVDDEDKTTFEIQTEINKGSGAVTEIESIGMAGTSLQIVNREGQRSNEDARVGDKEIQETIDIKVNDRVEKEIANENLEIKGKRHEATGEGATNEEGNAVNEQIVNTPVIVSQKEMTEEIANEKINIEVDIIEEKAVPIPAPVHTIHEEIQAETRIEPQIEKEEETVESLNYPVYVYQTRGENAPPTHPINDETQHSNEVESTTEIDVETDKEARIVNNTVGIEINGTCTEGEIVDDIQHIDEQLYVGNKETKLDPEINERKDKEGEIANLQMNHIGGEEKGKQPVEEELVANPSSDRKNSNEIKNKRGWKRKKSKDSEVDEKKERPGIDADKKERDSTDPPIDTTDSSSLRIHTPSIPSSEKIIKEELQVDSTDIDSDAEGRDITSEEIKIRRGWKKKVSKDKADILKELATPSDIGIPTDHNQS
jgi:hypothetical protein